MSLSVASYNVLADSYIRPKYYPNVPPAVLARERRHPALVARIAGLGVDVICLQEVERDVFEALEGALAGYSGLYLPKGLGKPDGCAIFAQAQRTRDHALHYPDGTGHVALTVEVNGVAITTTHFKWAPRGSDPHMGCTQAQELVTQRAAITNGAERWIVCGDLNATPDSPVIAILRGGGLRDAFSDAPPGTCNANGPARQLDYLLCSQALESSPWPTGPLADDEALPSLQEPSDHLPIRASFASV